MSQVRFERPPVGHVHLTLLYALDAQLQVSHLSALREAWRSDYPRTRERPPSPADAGDEVRFVPRGSVWPFPYLVFSAANQSVVIERDKFALTWTFGGGERDEYPGYDALKLELTERFRQFSEALTEELAEAPRIVGSECHYQNDLPAEDPARMIVGILTKWETDIPPSLGPKDGVYEGFRQHSTSTLDDQVEIVAGIDPMEGGPGAALFIETTRTDVDNAEETLGGIDRAHRVLIDTFLGMTRPDQHQSWGRIG